MSEQKKKRKIRDLVLFIGLIVVIALIVWFVFGDTIVTLCRLLFHGGEAEIKQYLAREGQWKGIASVVLLSMLQVISMFFPGFAIQIASGAIYGWWKALLMCYSGYVLGNVLIFSVVRHLGTQMNGLGLMPSFAKPNKKSNAILEKLKNTRPTVIVAVLNLIPVIPNGIIPYFAAGTSIRQLRFAEALMATCWVQMFFNCLAGGFLKNRQFGFMVFALSLQIVIMIMVALKGNQIVDWIVRFRKGDAAAPQNTSSDNKNA